MKRIVILIIVALPMLSFSQGRVREQLGFMVGGDYYLGDINKQHFNNTDLAFGVFYRRNQKNFRIAHRYNFSYAKVSAEDSDSDNPYYINRNLSFSSQLYELGYLLEVSFRKYDVGALKKYRSTPYIFGGLTYFYMNPKSNGEKLRDWSTEGQGVTTSRYSNHQLAIPFGLGFKANLTNRLAIGFEYGFRKTFTDFLDDVSGVYPDRIIMEEEVSKNWTQIADPSLDGLDRSGLQRGNSKDKDWYSIFGLYLTFQLNQNCGCSI